MLSQRSCVPLAMASSSVPGSEKMRWWLVQSSGTPRPWRAQFSMLWRRTSFIAGAGFGAAASSCTRASCPNVGMPKAMIMPKAMLTTLRVESALLSFMVGFSRRSDLQESCSHAGKALDAENDSRKTEITCHEINSEEQCWTDAYYTQEAWQAKCRPAFRFARVFETQALSCGKVHGLRQCHFSRETS